MAFNIKIKPLVLFDLEDKIKLSERKTPEEGKRLYQSFLASLSDLRRGIQEEIPVYESVRKYTSKDTLCSLFYTVSSDTVSIIGLL